MFVCAPVRVCVVRGCVSAFVCLRVRACAREMSVRVLELSMFVYVYACGLSASGLLCVSMLFVRACGGVCEYVVCFDVV